MAQQFSMERMIIGGDIKGPNWYPVDEEGYMIVAANQNFGHTRPGREVRLREDGSRIGYVIDLQDPAVVHKAETQSLSE